jgi:glutamyl-tRNA reductase
MDLLAAGVNHKTAELALRERITFAPGEHADALVALRQLPGIAEAALISTCNRTELYCLVDGEVPDLAGWLATWHRLGDTALDRHLYTHVNDEALRHMMRVAGGLDSLVLGEPQVLGQMREAYAAAHESGALGNDLARIFQQVFSVAKRIRTETGIGSNPVSVAYAAVSFARHIFADLSKNRALLIGAGETIELAARHLKEQGVRELVIANRTLARAEELAGQVGGKAIVLEELPAWLKDADILISSTASPLPLLGKGMVEKALKQRRHRPMFMVDIAVPRDIEPEVGDLDDVYLYTVDDLHEAIEENVRQRQEAAAEADKLIEEALQKHVRESREQHAVDTLRHYREQVTELGEAELQRAVKQLEKGGDAREVLERFRHNLINKILHGPSVQLRQLAAENRHDALELARELLLQDKQEKNDNQGG